MYVTSFNIFSIHLLLDNVNINNNNINYTTRCHIVTHVNK